MKITILGAGESGVGAAILAKEKGFSVFISDFGKIKDNYKKILETNNIEYEEEKHTEEKILSSKEIIKSPGIACNVPIIKKAKARNIKIISEIEFAARYTDAVKVCITGSNGKTTTTLLIYEIFKNAGLNVGLAGNIGQSFALQVAKNNFDYYILELSSFQLDNMYDFKAEVAIILNITPDHLDRYNNEFQQYVKSKFRITQNQTKNDYLIYNQDDNILIKQIGEAKINSQKLPFSLEKEVEKGAFVKNDTITIKINSNTMQQLATKELNLLGQHNIQNSMAAYLPAELYGINKKIIRETLTNFKSVEHRLEKHLTIRGITFINDSKATNVNSVWYALESIKTDIVLILGGKDKGNDYSILDELVSQKVKTIIAMGIDNSPIHKAFGDIVEIIDTKSMHDAVKSAYLLADKGDTVLLSPACASFDLFKNYEDRGEQFKEEVRNL